MGLQQRILKHLSHGRYVPTEELIAALDVDRVSFTEALVGLDALGMVEASVSYPGQGMRRVVEWRVAEWLPGLVEHCSARPYGRRPQYARAVERAAGSAPPMGPSGKANHAGDSAPVHAPVAGLGESERRWGQGRRW